MRVTAQLYSYKLADYKDVALDYAMVGYRFNEKLALDVGRVKRTTGLYGDVQDIDLVRPMAFLPLDFYPKAFRPVSAAVDGASVRGHIAMGASNSLDYQVYVGLVTPFSADTPFVLGVNDAAPFLTDSVDAREAKGATLFWNTPVEGLRFGVTYNDNKLTYGGVAKTAAQLASSPTESRNLPSALPAGLWAGSIAGRPVTSDISVAYSYASAEYTRGRWQFAAEYLYQRRLGVTALPVLGTSAKLAELDTYYFMVTYEASNRWNLAAYYGEGYADINDRRGRNNRLLPAHRNWLKDLAAGASYNLSANWLLKAEAHALNGTKGIVSTSNGDAAKWQPNWGYYVVKTTLSF